MNKAIIIAFGMILGMTSCQKTCNPDAEQQSINDRLTGMTFSDCNIRFDGVTFTKSLNGGDSLVTVRDSVMTFDCSEGGDLFNDPNGKLSNHTVPAIFADVDNTKPFTISVKVKPEFTPDGTYNAADLLVMVNDSLYQKLCFEQDERGAHRVVSVRTVGTSDDNNHDVINQDFVFLKISSDTRTIASYYSLDGHEWHMVRLYKNNYPEKIMIGLAGQAPVKGSCQSVFTDLHLDQSNVADFRMGE